MTAGWFKHGWKLKIISLGLAMGLWYYAVNEESVEITRVVPLTLKIENENVSILKSSADVLRVTLKVSRAMVSQVAGDDIRAVHSFGSDMKQAGEYSFHPDARELTLPSIGLTVVKIEPQVVRVVLDEMVIQKLPVTAQFTGEPAFGYKVRKEELQMDPNAVMVQGPKGMITKLTAISTLPINLTGRTRSFRITSEFDVPPLVKLQSAEFTDLSVPIQEVSEEKQLNDITVKMIRPSGALGIAEVSPQKISVTIQGPRRVLENLESEKMHAYVDLSGFDYGDHTADVLWVLPPGVTIKNDEHIQVKASITKPS